MRLSLRSWTQNGFTRIALSFLFLKNGNPNRFGIRKVSVSL
jgi:hypothetical protein